MAATKSSASSAASCRVPALRDVASVLSIEVDTWTQGAREINDSRRRSVRAAQHRRHRRGELVRERRRAVCRRRTPLATQRGACHSANTTQLAVRELSRDVRATDSLSRKENACSLSLSLVFVSSFLRERERENESRPTPNGGRAALLLSSGFLLFERAQPWQERRTRPDRRTLFPPQRSVRGKRPRVRALRGGGAPGLPKTVRFAIVRSRRVPSLGRRRRSALSTVSSRVVVVVVVVVVVFESTPSFDRNESRAGVRETTSKGDHEREREWSLPDRVSPVRNAHPTTRYAAREDREGLEVRQLRELSGRHGPREARVAADACPRKYRFATTVRFQSPIWKYRTVQTHSSTCPVVFQHTLDCTLEPRHQSPRTLKHQRES